MPRNQASPRVDLGSGKLPVRVSSKTTTGLRVSLHVPKLPRATPSTAITQLSQAVFQFPFRHAASRQRIQINNH